MKFERDGQKRGGTTSFPYVKVFLFCFDFLLIFFGEDNTPISFVLSLHTKRFDFFAVIFVWRVLLHTTYTCFLFNYYTVRGGGGKYFLDEVM